MAILLVITGIVTVSYTTMQQLVSANSVLNQKKRKKALSIRNKLKRKVGVQSVCFMAKDNVKLSGLLIQREFPMGMMVVCHGYRSDKEHFAHFVDLFSDFDILLFDFRAHGQSQGEVITIGYHEYKDVQAACAFMRNHQAYRQLSGFPLVVIGISMGGASTIKALSDCPLLCDAAVIDSSFADLSEIVNKVFSHHTKLPRFPFMPCMEFLALLCNNFNIRRVCPLQDVAKVQTPLMFIHSCDDTYTDVSDTIRLHAAAQNSHTSLWIGPPSKHGSLYKSYPDDYRNRVLKFLKTVCGSYDENVSA